MTHVPSVGQAKHPPQRFGMRNGSFVNLCRSQHFPPFENGVLLGQYQHFDRATGHEGHQAAVEELFPMLCVKITGQDLVDAKCFRLDDLEALLHDFRFYELVRKDIGDDVRFQDGQGQL